jgi:transposase
MPQARLPIFPEGAQGINRTVAFEKREGIVYYFNGLMPVFQHEEKDGATFHLFMSQLVVNGNCTQMEIVRAFGISAISMKRQVKKYREQGAAGFYGKRKGRGKSVLTEEVLAKAQELMDDGKKYQEAAAQLGVKKDTLQKAVRDGRLQGLKKKKR